MPATTVTVTGGIAAVSVDVARGLTGATGPAGSDANVTNANVRSAGALMDDEVTNLAQVKSFDSSDYDPAGSAAAATTPTAIRSQAVSYSTTGGGEFRHHSEIVTVADGVFNADIAETFQRTYHAFPSIIRYGSGYLASWMTSTPTTAENGNGHASARGDVIIARSDDLSGRNWKIIHRFTATRPNPANALELGDREYRVGGLVHLGGADIGILLDLRIVEDLANLSGQNRYYPAWAISRDGGDTFSAPETIPFFTGDSTAETGPGEPVIWQNYVWCPVYTVGNGRQWVARATLASVLAGTPSWTTHQVASFGNEICFLGPVGNSDAKLMAVLRENTSYGGYRVVSITAAQAASPPVGWTVEVNSWQIPSYVAQQPQIVKTAAGRYVAISRGPNSGSGGAEANLKGWIAWADTLGGTFTRSQLRGGKRKTKAAWNGLEKNMYFSAVPLGGDLLAVIFANEQDTQTISNVFNASYEAGNPLSSGGSWSSVFFGFIAAGTGETPMGTFAPLEADLPLGNPSNFPGMALRLLASEITDVSGGNMVWRCPISGLRWTATNAAKPTYSRTASANSKPALTSTAGSTRRLTFDATSGALPTTGIKAVYFGLKHNTGGAGGLDCVVVNIASLNSSNHWGLATPFTSYYTMMDNVPVRADGAAAIATLGPTANAWHVLSFRIHDSATSFTLANFTEIMNQASLNRGWNGALTCIYAFSRNLTPAEHAAMITHIGTL